MSRPFRRSQREKKKQVRRTLPLRCTPFHFVSFEHHQLVEPLEIVSLTLVSENAFNSRQGNSELFVFFFLFPFSFSTFMPARYAIAVYNYVEDYWSSFKNTYRTFNARTLRCAFIFILISCLRSTCN